jgi:hypothetical protein
MADPLPTPPGRAQTPAACPRWPMLTHRQEKLMMEVWHLQQSNGWCYAGEAHLGSRIGVEQRQVRNLIRQLNEQRWLMKKYRHGQTLLLRVVLPENGPRYSGRVNPGNPLPGSPRQSVAAHPGNPLPPKRNTILKSESVGGNAPPGADAGPLFSPPQPVNVRQHQFAQQLPSACHALAFLFRRGDVSKVKLDGRMRLIATAEVHTIDRQRIRLTLPTKNGGCDVRDWYDEHILKLEFYP